MPSHVALLRGINVGGRNKVAMADLRKVESLGHGDVATYIQSGDVVSTSNHTDTAAIAGELGRALKETLGVQRRGAVASRTGQGDCRQPVSRRGQPQAPPCHLPRR